MFVTSKKDINDEQFFDKHVTGPKIAICETTSGAVFILNSAFTTKDHYFQVALEESMDAFNAVMPNFEHIQTLARYNPKTHQVHPP